VSLSTFLSTREGGRVERRGGLKRESLIFFLFVCFARGGGKKKERVHRVEEVICTTTK